MEVKTNENLLVLNCDIASVLDCFVLSCFGFFSLIQKMITGKYINECDSIFL